MSVVQKKDTMTDMAPETPERRTGHCLCGAITYEYDEPVNWCGHCHCESCRRACSAPMTTFFGVENGRWRWTGAGPTVFASSKGVERMFCATCGSQMAYRTDHFPNETHFYAATLEAPEDFAPEKHFFHGEKLPWLHLADDLKKHEVGGL